MTDYSEYRVFNGSVWNPAKEAYRHNGQTWEKVWPLDVLEKPGRVATPTVVSTPGSKVLKVTWEKPAGGEPDAYLIRAGNVLRGSPWRPAATGRLIGNVLSYEMDIAAFEDLDNLADWGSRWECQIMARNAAGDAPNWSPAGKAEPFVKPEPVRPGPPKVTQDPTTKHIRISWDAVPGATGYHAHWRRSAGGSWQTRHTGTALFTDYDADELDFRPPGVPSDFDFYFEADTPSGKVESEHTTATLDPLPPQPPTGLKAVHEDKSVPSFKVTWNSAFGATGYRLSYRFQHHDSAAPNLAEWVTVSVDGTSHDTGRVFREYKDRKLASTDFDTFEFKVATVTASGPSADSRVVTAIVEGRKAASPGMAGTIEQVSTEPGNLSFLVEWEMPPVAEGEGLARSFICTFYEQHRAYGSDTGPDYYDASGELHEAEFVSGDKFKAVFRPAEQNLMKQATYVVAFSGPNAHAWGTPHDLSPRELDVKIDGQGGGQLPAPTVKLERNKPAWNKWQASWTAVEGASSYKLKWNGVTPDGKGQHGEHVLTDLTGLEYKYTGTDLAWNETVTCQVAAVDANGVEGEWSLPQDAV
ncbi:hypothetical protein [Streptomyces sp. NPDC059708]|uniref:hypothetical protein n=1 Tax=Streptomyces sp. NPDC059708 TaxID=3346916 RepID=UPI0036C55F3A